MLKTSPGGQSALADIEKRLTGRVPDDSDVPGPVRKAVRFMLAGGGLTVIVCLFFVFVAIADKNVLTDSSGKKITSSEFTSSIVGSIVTYLIVVAIWVLMARFNRSGRNWARIVASVLCAISTYSTFKFVDSLTGGVTFTVAGIISIVLQIALWVVGVIAIALIWRSESSAYFASRSAER